MNQAPQRGVKPDGEVIRRIRTAQGLTQEMLAKLSKCDVRTVRNAEHGRRIDLKTLEKISTALQAPVSECLQDNSSAQDINAHIVGGWLEAASQGDVPRMIALMSGDAMIRIPDTPSLPSNGLLCGKDEIRDALESARANEAGASISFQRCRYFPTADHVFVEAAMCVGRQRRQSIEASALMKFRLHERKIIEVFISYDTLLLQSFLQKK